MKSTYAWGIIIYMALVSSVPSSPTDRCPHSHEEGEGFRVMSLPRHVFSDVIYVGPVFPALSEHLPSLGWCIPVCPTASFPRSCLLLGLPRLLAQFGSADENRVYLRLFLLALNFPCSPACRLPLYRESTLRVSGSSPQPLQ